MKKIKAIIISLLFICVSAYTYTQNSITGTFPGLTKQQIKLVGFNGLATYAIDSTQANEKGQFQLSFGIDDFGMAYLL